VHPQKILEKGGGTKVGVIGPSHFTINILSLLYIKNQLFGAKTSVFVVGQF